MSKKALALTLVATLLLPLLAGCGGAAPTATPEKVVVRETVPVKETVTVKETVVMEVTPTPAPKGPTVNVEFWSALGGNLGETIKDFVFRYNSLQSDVHVNNEFQGDYYTVLQKFLAGLAANTVPDIVQLDCMYTPYLASTGAYANLDEFVNGPNGVDTSDLLAGFADGDKWEGHFYAWSFARSTPLMYINADAFKEAGLDPVPPATWDELVTDAKKLVKKDDKGEVVQYGFQLPLRNWWYLESMFRSNGGRIFDPEAGKATLEEPEEIEVLQAIQDLIKEGVATTAPDSGTGTADFLLGKAAIAYQSTAQLANNLNQATFEVKVGFIPRWGDTYAVTPGGSCFAIPAASKNKEAAWAFLKWVTSPELTAEWAMRSGYIPLRKSALETERLQDFYGKNPEYTVAVDQAQYAAPLPLIKAVPIIPEDFYKCQDEIFIGLADVKATAKKYDEIMTNDFQAWLEELKQ